MAIYLGPFMRLKDFSFGKLLVAVAPYPLRSIEISSQHHVFATESGKTNIGLALSPARVVRIGHILEEESLPYSGNALVINDYFGSGEGNLSFLHLRPYHADHYFDVGMTPDDALALPISGYGPLFWEQWFAACSGYDSALMVDLWAEFLRYFAASALMNDLPWMEEEEDIVSGWNYASGRFMTEIAPEPVAMPFYNWVNWLRSSLAYTPVPVSPVGGSIDAYQVHYALNSFFPRDSFWEVSAGYRRGSGYIYPPGWDSGWVSIFQTPTPVYFPGGYRIEYQTITELVSAWNFFADRIEDYGQRVEVWTEKGKFLWRSPNAVEIDMEQLLSQLEEESVQEMLAPANAYGQTLWGHLKTHSLEVFGYKQDPDQSELLGVFGQQEN